MRSFPEGCLSVLTSFSLNKNETREFSFTISLYDKNSFELANGEYILEGYLLDNNSSAISKKFIIK
ncbi:MAG: hypothetical protein IPH62_00860 [Ignavibacteriae bacterium]|nr:hypothetical protein [Ignavibacteriota bacterium]